MKKCANNSANNSVKRNYKNKVCFIQSEEIFQDDTRRQYLKINGSQLLTSNDKEEIFDFIKKHVSDNKILSFVLHIDSGTLSDLLEFMEEKKQSSCKTRKWLKTCNFVATYSNSKSVRDKVTSLNVMNVYFSLAPIASVLNNIPNGNSNVVVNPDGTTGTPKPKEVMVIVSNTPSSFFDEVFNYFNDVNTTLTKTRVSGLTLDKINEFAQGGGYQIVFSGDTEADYNKVGSLIKDSTFRKQVHIIECTQILSQGLDDIRSVVSDVITSASGVSIQAMLSGLNRTIPYESCAASITLTWATWPLYISGRVVNRPMDDPL